MNNVINRLQPYVQPVCEKALAVALIILSILGCVLLAITLGDRD